MIPNPASAVRWAAGLLQAHVSCTVGLWGAGPGWLAGRVSSSIHSKLGTGGPHFCPLVSFGLSFSEPAKPGFRGGRPEENLMWN